MRQALGRPVLLRCTLLRGSPQRIASAVWRFKGQLLPPPPVVPAATETTDHAELRLDALTRDSSGSYECSVSNDVGSATCLFQVSGERPVGPTRAFPPTPTWSQAPPAVALPHLAGLRFNPTPAVLVQLPRPVRSRCRPRPVEPRSNP